jgi:ribonuclease-3
LEFLGDSILGLLISFFLYENFPDKSEGELTKLKATLVSEPSLNLVASSIGLGRYIFLSVEEEKSGGREKASIISDAFEAIVGAIFVDGGLTQAKKVVQGQVFSRFSELTDESIFYNYKGELLEYLQAREVCLPRYEVMEEEGPDHQKIFTIAVVIKGKKMGVGMGASKKDAEQNAAKEALKRIGENSYNQKPEIKDPNR